MLFETFRDVQEFQSKFRRCISNYVTRLREAEAGRSSDESKSISSGGSSGLASQTGHSRDAVFPTEVNDFLEDLIKKPDSLITRTQAARFRLLGQILRRQGNDEQTIGAHDANTLFLERATLTLSQKKQGGLIDCELDNFQNSNCPLWHWVSSLGLFQANTLPVYALFGPTKIRRGALEAMRLIEEPFSRESDRSYFFDSCLAKDSDSDLKVAALQYLGACGIEPDLIKIREELERGDYRTRSAAIDAILRISLRESREKSALALIDLQPDTVDRDLLKNLFGDDVTTDILLRGLSSRSSAVRLALTRILNERGALREVAEKLFDDTDASVRLDAVLSLEGSSRKISEQEAKSILVKPKATTGLFGVAGGDYDRDGSAAFERFREKRIAELSESDLNALVESVSIYDETPYLVRADKYFSSYGDALRGAVQDGFEKYFAENSNRWPLLALIPTQFKKRNRSEITCGRNLLERA